jgi:hypothetical protein
VIFLAEFAHAPYRFEKTTGKLKVLRSDANTGDREERMIKTATVEMRGEQVTWWAVAEFIGYAGRRKDQSCEK